MTEEMTKEMAFFMYLLEYYANYKNMSSGDVMKLWDDKNITKKIFDNYWIYHTEAIENAYMDIDSLIATGKHAY